MPGVYMDKYGMYIHHNIIKYVYASSMYITKSVYHSLENFRLELFRC